MKPVTYKEWQGKNSFFCKGKLMTGVKSDNSTLYTAYVALIGISGYFFATVGVYFWIKANLAPIVVGMVIFLATLYFMLSTTFTDPGVIPRGNLEPPQEPKPVEQVLPNAEREERKDNSEHIIAIPQNEGVQSVQREPENTTNKDLDKPLVQKEVPTENNPEKKPERRQVNKVEDVSIYQHRYCTTCKIMRPPRSSHCSQCDNCVKGFDHHCGFVGNCVGERNLKYFVAFLCSATAWTFYTIILSWIALGLTFGYNKQIDPYLPTKLGFWISGGALIIFAVLFLCQKFMSQVKALCIVIGFTLIIIGFIVAGSDVNLMYYENPGVILVNICVIFPFSFWIMCQAANNVMNISKGFSLKEIVRINHEIQDPAERKRFLNPTFNKRCRNLTAFFMKRKEKSELEGTC